MVGSLELGDINPHLLCILIDRVWIPDVVIINPLTRQFNFFESGIVLKTKAAWFHTDANNFDMVEQISSPEDISTMIVHSKHER